MKKTNFISVARTATLCALELAALYALMIMWPEDFGSLVVTKAAAFLMLYVALRLYGHWAKTDPWIKAYAESNERALCDGTTPTHVFSEDARPGDEEGEEHYGTPV